MKESFQYRRVEKYIKLYALPKKLGRVIYPDNCSREIIELIRYHGLTPISFTNYQRLQFS